MKHQIQMKAIAVAIVLLAISVQTVKAQWDSCGPGGCRVTALCVMGSTIIAGTADSGVYLSTDNGTSWKAANSGLTYLGTHYLGIICVAVRGRNIFMGTESGGVFLSANNGATWTGVNSGLVNLGVSSLVVSGSNIFAGTLGSGVFLSADTGKHWTGVNSGLTYLGINSLVMGGGDIFAGTSNGGVFLSTNSGTNWTGVNTGLPQNIKYVYSLAVNGSSIFAGTFRGVFLSTNKGASWMAIDSGLTNLFVWTLVVKGSNVFAGSDAGVFISADNGTSWKAANSGLSNLAIYSLATNENYIFAGTWGSGVWRRPVSDFAGTINPTRQLSSPANFKILHPSTAGSKASIEFSLQSRERVRFSIFSFSGCTIHSLADKQFEPGPQKLFWDTQSLAPGCYIVKMQSQTNSCVKYFTLMR